MTEVTHPTAHPMQRKRDLGVERTRLDQLSRGEETSETRRDAIHQACTSILAGFPLNSTVTTTNGTMATAQPNSATIIVLHHRN